MDIDAAALAARQTPEEFRTTDGEPPNIVTSKGVVIIEELDSPSTRREKNMRRKAEKLQAAHATFLERMSANQTLNPSEPIAGPSRLPANESSALDSDLSSLSESDGETGMKRASSPVMAGPKIPRSDGRIGTDVVELGVVTFPLEGGTLGTSFHFTGA